MIDPTPSALAAEIDAAQKFRDRYLAGYEERVRRYTGPGYCQGGSGSAHRWPENHAYEFLSLVVPKVVHDNPQVHVRSRGGPQAQAVASALQAGLNQWIRVRNLRQTLVRLAYDAYLSPYGVSLVTQEPMPGYSAAVPGERQWPRLSRVSPRHFFWDPLALTYQQARFAGQCIVADKADLLLEAQTQPEKGWDAASLMGAAEGVDERAYSRGAKAGEVPDRKELLLHEVWVPEHTPEGLMGYEAELFSGTMYTLCMTASGAATQVRAPRPFFGPRWGPYSLFGIYPVPDQAVPLSPIEALEGQVNELNLQAIAANDGAMNYKRVVFVSASNPEVVKKAKNSPHDWVIPVKGFSKDEIVAVELGGTSQQQLEQLAMMRERVDRVSGISDAMRGNTQPGVTATADSIADSASTVRLAFQQRQFEDATVQSLRSAAWYLYHDDRVRFALDNDAAQELGMQEPWYFGGSDPSGPSFDDHDFMIEPYSMERINEAMLRQNTVAAAEFVMKVTPMVIQYPWTKWETIVDQVGAVLNIPNLSEPMNISVGRQIGMMSMMAAMTAPQEPQQQGGGPPGKAS